MIIPRVIPCLLLKGAGLVKGVRFREHKYVGDPINAVRIFSEKEADELIFLDISAGGEGRIPPIELIERIADECFMPFAVGGGIRTVEQIGQLLYAGAEKVCINTSLADAPELVAEAAVVYGSQSIVASIDYRKKMFGGVEVCTMNGRKKTGRDPVDFAREMEKAGAGEILLTSIDRDGTMSGYDIEMIQKVAWAVDIPVIAGGGAGKMKDLRAAVAEGGASAVAAGSLFVFHGPKRAVLITFPERGELEEMFGS